MTISELIERLEAIKAEHGDLPVYGDGDWIYTPGPFIEDVKHRTFYDGTRPPQEVAVLI